VYVCASPPKKLTTIALLVTVTMFEDGTTGSTLLPPLVLAVASTEIAPENEIAPTVVFLPDGTLYVTVSVVPTGGSSRENI